jgi:hypothetical protein
MLPLAKRRGRFRFSVRALLLVVALIGVGLGLIVRPVVERRRFMSWVEQNGGHIDRWVKPEPDITVINGGLTIISTSYQRILGPERDPEIPDWRKWLGDVAVNIVMLPVDSKNSDVEAAKLLFPEAEVQVMQEPGPGGVF